ncbi:hypothetical protein EHS13_14260 [Paenibacillus psychroresistens]|uniref:Uncharacterized protein n=1 Tax=Paenibacillus psychroresistens TaxID=1778678 RepID=A0A6B8RK74_9BACL|nr:hypothetical protein [Paenibacillus psychroresistens]QGQ95953.1 hypothetical protein EHS13_14260 [Paenibacillus psychroresistens]
MQELSEYRFSTIVSSDEGYVYAGTFGQGILRMSLNGSWQVCSEGLPADVTIYRLQRMGTEIYAATEKGLFMLHNNKWQSAGLEIPCYHIVDSCNTFAMTRCGLMYSDEGEWMPFAYPNRSCYDFLMTPQFLFIALSSGIAYYDMLTGSWDEFAFQHAVTSIAVFRKSLIGVLADGSMVIGNKKGGFITVAFEGMFIYKLATYKGNVFACSNNGLFKIVMLQDRLILQSLGIHCAVTDLVFAETHMLIATLNQGILKNLLEVE